ncbi:Coronin-like protein Crn1 [Malassezia pachydermatis]
MSGRFVRSSKYRHVYGNPAKKEVSFDNVKVSNNAWDTNLLSCSGTFVSLNWQVSGGGAFALLPLDHPGKLPDLYPLCRGHTSAVLDTAFSPFDDEVLVSGGDDAQLSVWKVSQDDIVSRLESAKKTGSMDDIKPQASFNAGKRRVGQVEFHPTAANVVAAATGDVAIKLFDIEAQKARVELRGFGDAIQSMAFDQTGSLMVATCRDRKLRLFDTRAPDNVQVVDSHGGIKGARAVWCGDKPRIITTGFSKMSERQMFLWDVQQLAKPIKTVALDSSNGIIMPFWSDNNIVFLAGKGDGNIRYYELESDELHYLTEYKSIEPQSGMTFLPRRALNVNENEIARAYKVTSAMVQPLSFYVPRKADSFQADIFPPAPSLEPAMTASEFFDEKKTRVPNLMNFETKQTIASSDVAPLSMASTALSSETPKEEVSKTDPEAKEAAKREPEAKKEAAKVSEKEPEAKKEEKGEPTTHPKEETTAAPKEDAKAEPKEEASQAKGAPKDTMQEEAKDVQKDEGTALKSSELPTTSTGAPSKAAPAAAAATTVTATTATSASTTSMAALEKEIQALKTQVAERDTRIRELEMENLKLRTNQQRVRDVLLSST